MSRNKIREAYCMLLEAQELHAVAHRWNTNRILHFILVNYFRERTYWNTKFLFLLQVLSHHLTLVQTCCTHINPLSVFTTVDKTTVKVIPMVEQTAFLPASLPTLPKAQDFRKSWVKCSTIYDKESNLQCYRDWDKTHMHILAYHQFSIFILSFTIKDYAWLIFYTLFIIEGKTPSELEISPSQEFWFHNFPNHSGCFSSLAVYQFTSAIHSLIWSGVNTCGLKACTKNRIPLKFCCWMQ